MLVMFIMAFFAWWYGKGWQQVFSSLTPRLRSVSSTFSVTQLSKTLFAPWRRIVTYPGSSLAEKFHALGDNLFSRVIGFIVRLLVLIAAFFTLVAVGVVTIVEIIVWPLLPFGVVGFIIAGLV
jgi:hypothetical protein